MEGSSSTWRVELDKMSVSWWWW